MLISASRRTDIPALYADWFFHRLGEGFVLVRNPRNKNQVACVDLRSEAVEGIVFWTKNPLPMVQRLPLLAPYPYYFQFTLTPYGTDIEPGLPPKHEVLVPAFQALAGKIGAKRVIWRYDPIIFTKVYTPEFHLAAFEALAARLSGFTNRCTISFVDFYRKASRALQMLKASPPPLAIKVAFAKQLSEIATHYGISLTACAEAELPIPPAACVDGALFAEITGFSCQAGKDTGQRPGCFCAPSVDIGAYNTCTQGCRYCYAVSGAVPNMGDVTSPLLGGKLSENDVVKPRKNTKVFTPQQRLFTE